MALVTGGTRGIGRAVSSLLVEAGARVHCIYRSDDEAAGQLAESLGSTGRFSTVRADVTDADQTEALFKSIASESGALHILVNVAGRADDGLLLRAGPDKVRAGLELNLEAAITCCRLALGPMLAAGYGRIINVSSVVAAMGNAGQTVYAAAKAGLEGFSRSLAREVGTKGVTVNCVAPGLIETGMTGNIDPALRERAVEATALRRAGSSEEVAWAVGYLASEAAGYVTGTVLQVNGGMYM